MQHVTHFSGNQHPHFSGNLHPHFSGEKHPHFAGELHPHFSGEKHPHFAGELHPHFQGRFQDIKPADHKVAFKGQKHTQFGDNTGVLMPRFNGGFGLAGKNLNVIA